MTDTPVRAVTDEGDLETALAESLAVIYKHSSRCGICTGALVEVQQFAASHPDVPVYVVDVIAQRGLSQRLAERLEVRHQSPQAILVRDGHAVWHGSHYRVSSDRLDSALAEARTAYER